MCKKKSKKSKRIDITHLCGFKTDYGENTYTRDNVIIERCTGHAELRVDDVAKGKTEQHTSGAASKYPGSNWTGVLPDVNGQRYGRTISEEYSHKLKTCVEGKCIYDIVSGFDLIRTYGQTNVLISIYISYDQPCLTCDAAIQYWIDSWKFNFTSLSVHVVGRTTIKYS